MVRLSKNTLGMLIAKYRAVLLHMCRKEAVALAVSGLLLAAPAPAWAADYHVGAGQAYATLEALRTDGAVSFQNGDKIILHASDASLSAAFVLPDNLQLTLEAAAPGLVISPGTGSQISGIVADSGSLTLSGITLNGFSNTTGYYGGAIYGFDVTIESGADSFSNNIANGSGGAIFGSYVTVESGANSFSNNTANGSGGAIFGSTVTIEGGANSFSNNTANGSGGAIYSFRDADLTADGGDLSFTGNRAGGDGGAVYVDEHAVLTAAGGNILFTGNTDATGANALYLGNWANNKSLTLAARNGYSIRFDDPVASNSSNPNLTININPAAADTGTIRFDQYRSNLYGSTTVHHGTLALTNGAIYGVNGHTGSFTLESNARLNADAGGNAIAAGAVTFGNNSTLGFDLTDAIAVGQSGETTNLTVTGSAVNINPVNLNIDILALNGGGNYKLVGADGITWAGKTLTLRGESFANTRAYGALFSLTTITEDSLALSIIANNGVMRWNGGNGSWNASGESWTGLDTSAAPGGADLRSETKFLHGDAVVFDNAAGGAVAIQENGVQVAARPDGSGGDNPGLTIKSGDWIFTGGELAGGNIRFAGDGGIAFDSRTLTQRITVDSGKTASLGATDGSTLTLAGHAATGDGGAIDGGNAGNIILSGSGSLRFTNNTATLGGAIYGSTVTIESGTNSFSDNTANGHGGAIYGFRMVTISGGTNSFSDNTANYSGGAIYSLYDAALTADGGDLSFTGNRAGGYGGAVYVDEHAVLTAAGGNILFTGNTDAAGANALYLGNWANNKSLTLAARNGYAIRFDDPVASNSSRPNLTIDINPAAADTGTIRFDQHRSNLYGSTTVHHGTLALANGATYGAAANSGSFTLDTGARLSVDAAGGAVNAGNINLQGGSTTAVDVSGGKLLTLNGNVAIASGASLDVTGYSAGAVDIIVSNNTISGNFTILKIGGVAQTDSMPSLDRYINSTFVGKTDDGKAVTVKQGGLVWNNTDDGTAHGTFNVASDFTLGAALADNTNTAAHGFGWDGTILTKEGAGTLTLTGDNRYSGGTLLNSGTLVVGHDSALGSGALTMAADTSLSFAGNHSLTNAVAINGSATVTSDTDLNASFTGMISGSGSLTKTGSGSLTLTGNNTYAGGTSINAGSLTVNSLAALGSGDIVNNARLNFFRSAPTGGQTINLTDRYSGSGSIGMQASLTETAQWSDLLQFDSAPQDNTSVCFTFTDGSSLSWLPAAGLHFAELGAASGNDASFVLDKEHTTLGADELVIKTTDNQNYRLIAEFNPTLAKVYSETAAGTLGQAAGMHGQETFKNIGQAAANAAGGQTGVYAGMGRGDVRHNSGSHADVKGNNLALALAWENGSTTWGLTGQKFTGSYKTTHAATVGGAAQSIHSNGDLKQHDFGLFAEYRPDDSGRYWQGLIKAGQSRNDFRADNANNGSRFSSGRSVFGLSAGGGFIKELASNRSRETYQHLIYTRLGSDRVIDSIGQNIRFDSDASVRLLTGVRWTLKQQGKADYYAGVALDYEFSGKTSASINAKRANSADLQGLTGILELGFSARQSETLSIDGTLYGYAGKKEGVSGGLTLTKRF